MSTSVTKKSTGTKTVQKKVVKNESIELPANPFIFEVLNLVSKQRSNTKKIEVLQKYSHPSLKTIFIWNFDESVISMLQEG